jgi:hypothetical protein
MGRRAQEETTFRIAFRVGRRRPFVLVVNGIGLVVAVVLLGWGLAEVLSGTTAGVLTGLGLAATALVAAYLYVPGLVASGRGLTRAGTDRLRLDEHGIVVNHGAGPFVEARLAWEDCAAVVSSALPMPHGQVAVYVQFVASRADAAVYPPHDRAIGANARVLAVPEALAALTCFTPYRRRHEIRDCVAWVRLHHPEVRVVESGSAEHLVDGDAGGGRAPLGEAVERPEVARGGEAGDEQPRQGGLEAR